MNLLQLLGEKVDPQKIKRASGRCGGEYHSPCPMCGGNDRFMVFPEQDGGDLCQKYGLRGTWSCTRGCGKGGDMLTWFTEVEGMSFSAACAELKIELDGKPERSRSYRPLRMPSSGSLDFVPSSYVVPCEKWREQATKLATEAHARLLSTPVALAYLSRRGLPLDAVKQYRLGYIEGENKTGDCIFRNRAAFGLPPKVGQYGKPVHAFRIPRGITIPAWSEDGSQCLRIRVRRRNSDLQKNNPKDPKYLLVPQPDRPFSSPLMLPPVGVIPDLATWVIVESELDAMAVHYACGGRVGALSILSVRVKPDRAAHALLERSPRILVALDVDEDKADGSNPGADAWPWWEKTYPQARLWPVPVGKDPGEAFAQGVPLEDWISAGMPLPLSRAEEPSSGAQEVQQKAVESEPPVGAMGKPAFFAASVEGKGPDFLCWPLPKGAQTVADVRLPTPKVSAAELVDVLRRRNISDPDCLIPCPKTKPPFWYRYRRGCGLCSGHPKCLLGVLSSEIFQKAAYGDDNAD